MKQTISFLWLRRIEHANISLILQLYVYPTAQSKRKAMEILQIFLWKKSSVGVKIGIKPIFPLHFCITFTVNLQKFTPNKDKPVISDWFVAPYALFDTIQGNCVGYDLMCHLIQNVLVFSGVTQLEFRWNGYEP